MMTTRLQQPVHIDPPPPRPLPSPLPPAEIFYQGMGLCKQIIFSPALCRLKPSTRVTNIFIFIFLFAFPVSYCNLKGIDRSFELRREIRLIRSVMTNWRLGNFCYLILNSLHHKISKKPIVAA